MTAAMAVAGCGGNTAAVVFDAQTAADRLHERLADIILTAADVATVEQRIVVGASIAATPVDPDADPAPAAPAVPAAPRTPQAMTVDPLPDVTVGPPPSASAPPGQPESARPEPAILVTDLPPDPAMTRPPSVIPADSPALWPRAGALRDGDRIRGVALVAPPCGMGPPGAPAHRYYLYPVMTARDARSAALIGALRALAGGQTETRLLRANRGLVVLPQTCDGIRASDDFSARRLYAETDLAEGRRIFDWIREEERRGAVGDGQGGLASELGLLIVDRPLPPDGPLPVGAGWEFHYVNLEALEKPAEIDCTVAVIAERVAFGPEDGPLDLAGVLRQRSWLRRQRDTVVDGTLPLVRNLAETLVSPANAAPIRLDREIAHGQVAEEVAAGRICVDRPLNG